MSLSFLPPWARSPAGSTPFTLDADLSAWDWSQLWRPDAFRWTVGKTPMADLAVVATAWALYAVTILGLQ
ncbi:hypothetical protein BDK51DRAFT_41002, partial [Blyttiomyces helicus]